MIFIPRKCHRAKIPNLESDSVMPDKTSLPQPVVKTADSPTIPRGEIKTADSPTIPRGENDLDC